MPKPRADKNTARPAGLANLVRHVLNIIGTNDSGDIERGRMRLLGRLQIQLGPVQWEHVTDHCERVSMLARHIAAAMGLSPQQTERIRIAGLLHDIGKCLIPETLLAKPAALTADEWSVMKRHERYGVWIAQRLGVDRAAATCIKYHHRRFDAEPTDEPGNARVDSPDHEPIPIGASILCTADALVTMLSERPYCPARSVASGLNELHLQRGRQFDPDVVDAVGSSETITRRLAA